MKLEEVLQAIRDGRKVRRESWDSRLHVHLHSPDLREFTRFDLLADDWIIVEEHKPCPFCGGETEYVGWVQCKRCYAMTGTMLWDTAEQHWAAWDKRTP